MTRLQAASVQYSFTPIQSFEDFAKKISKIVVSLKEKNVELIVFPEYLGAHLFSLNLKDKLTVCSGHVDSFLNLFDQLSKTYQIWIQAGTILIKEGDVYYNRAYFFDPIEKPKWQDKIHLTRAEKGVNFIGSGDELNLFKTPWGEVAILVCYDIEFPFLAKEAVYQGAKLILVPSMTETLSGYYRVSLSCRARAVENQCFVIQSCTVGESDVDWFSENCGRAGIFSPCDKYFPSSGILAEGELNNSQVIQAELNFTHLDNVRTTGEVLNYQEHTLLKSSIKVKPKTESCKEMHFSS